METPTPANAPPARAAEEDATVAVIEDVSEASTDISRALLIELPET